LSKNKSENKFTWAEAFRDIIVASMDKGQLPILFLFGTVFALIWKLDGKDSLSLLSSVGNQLINWYIYGYILFFLSLVSWYITAKMLRKMHFEECDRVGKEKSDLQEKLLNHNQP
jgi:p-aminobenzoyl-glutamate transporter AbgT